MALSLEVQQLTFLKQSTAQASTLSDANKHEVKAADILGLTGFDPLDDEPDDVRSHIKVSLATPINGITTWYVFQRHAVVIRDGAVVYPGPEDDLNNTKQVAATVKPTYTGIRIGLPSKTIVYSDQPIVAGGHFGWGEATHNATRLPQSREHEANIINLAKQLEKVAAALKMPVRVTSWYRPEPYNSRVGGAKKSQHLTGKGVDIAVQGMTGAEIAQKVVGWWPGGIGLYPGNRKHICHLDIGAKRRWGF